MLHTTKVKQQLVGPGPATSDTWPTFDQNQFTSTYNLNSQQNFQHNFNSSLANNNSSSSSSSSTFNTSNLTSNLKSHPSPHSSITSTHSSFYSSFSPNQSNASYLEKQLLLKHTRELLLEKQQKLNNSICSSVGHEESSSTSLSSTCFAISVEENSEHCRNDLNDCMDDTEDAAADFSPVLSPGRKRNYTPNVDGFSKKDTAQVTAQTSTLILELPTRIPAPIPPPNSPSLMMNRHQFQNSTISATSSASSLCSSAEGGCFANISSTNDFNLNKRARFEFQKSQHL